MTQIDEKALDVAVESLRPLFREPVSYLEQAARDSIAAYIAALPPAGEVGELVERLRAAALVACNYTEAHTWRPFSGELFGLLTQIDNITSGLSRTARADLDSPAPQGDGWVLVPKQITDEMAQAFFDARDDYERLKADKVFPRPTQADYIYRAMIAATPAKGARDE
jgi:hypothetical protein